MPHHFCRQPPTSRHTAFLFPTTTQATTKNTDTAHHHFLCPAAKSALLLGLGCGLAVPRLNPPNPQPSTLTSHQQGHTSWNSSGKRSARLLLAASNTVTFLPRIVPGRGNTNARYRRPRHEWKNSTGTIPVLGSPPTISPSPPQPLLHLRSHPDFNAMRPLPLLPPPKR